VNVLVFSYGRRNLDVDGRIILRWIVRKLVGVVGTNGTGSGKG
jgi:hypothetical protein